MTSMRSRNCVRVDADKGRKHHKACQVEGSRVREYRQTFVARLLCNLPCFALPDTCNTAKDMTVSLLSHVIWRN